jgi:hypothetical protein
MVRRGRLLEEEEAAMCGLITYWDFVKSVLNGKRIGRQN